MMKLLDAVVRITSVTIIK